MRLFLATAKGDDDLRIEEAKHAVAALLPNATVTDGMTDWQQNFHRCGGWNGWIEDVAAGRELGGRPRYDGIIAPYTTVGRATAQIVQRALSIGKPVVHMRRDGTAARVVAIGCDDPDSWKAGWTLVIEEPTR
jgi:hypothetical protein